MLAVAAYLLKHFGIWDELQTQLDSHLPTATVADGEGTWRIQRVVDGDTVVLQDGQRVRLIGVDTPETKHPARPVEPFGPEASAFTKRAVEGRVVQLKFDREKIDRYQRVLAYVYVGDWCLNEELIRAGYSRCITKYPFDRSMKARFRLAEQEARQQQRGIWSMSPRVASRPND